MPSSVVTVLTLSTRRSTTLPSGTEMMMSLSTPGSARTLTPSTLLAVMCLQAAVVVELREIEIILGERKLRPNQSHEERGKHCQPQ